jgi:hypothetical protein
MLGSKAYKDSSVYRGPIHRSLCFRISSIHFLSIKAEQKESERQRAPHQLWTLLCWTQ